ncbi:Uncharacterised protein [uncultured archaeon]|nr:Uncharacterised protein [uncultured archaeon]
MNYDPNHSLSRQLEELAKMPTDPKTLPYDSFHAAQLRMIWDESHGKGYDAIDSLLVIGDPNESVFVSSDKDEMAKQFLEHGKRRKELMAGIDASLKKRHEEYLNLGRYKEVLDSMKYAA